MPDIDFSLVDFKALSEPVCKLIEAVQGAIGILYQPTHTRRMAEAERDVAIIRALGEADVALIQAKSAEELEEIALRASARLNSRELRRQINIESIVSRAARELPASVSDEKVDEDWIVQFFEYCQDISDEQMQTLWARLLAGEVAIPGTYSLRTLQLVRVLRKSDAELFTHFCNYTWTSRDAGIIHLCSDQTDKLLESKGLHLSHILHLRSIGLISTAFCGEISFFIGPDDPSEEFFYYGRRHLVTHSTTGPVKKSIHALPFTDIGQELAPISGSKPDEEYRAALVKSWIGQGMLVQVSDDIQDDPNASKQTP